MDVKGSCDTRFAGVRDRFQSLFDSGQEIGAAVAIWYQGDLVVNLWGGERDKAKTQPWTANTVVNTFSTSKMISALCVQRAVDSGDLDLNRLVKDYWPEYACHGKAATKVAWLLNHKAGLPALRDSVPGDALFDWEQMCERLAKETPWWQPGKQHGYHMVTFGWLVGEVFRRALGVTLGEYLAAEIALPNQLDIFLGLDESQHLVADLFAAQGKPSDDRIYLFAKVLAEPAGITAKALANPGTLLTSSNKPRWRAMELPSANIHSSAESLARILGLCLQGDKVISGAAVQRLLTEESVGMDPVLTTDSRFGPGVMLPISGHPEAGFGKVKTAFGHPGSGGSLAFADPHKQVAFAYVMNQMGPYLLVDPRPRSLVDAFYRSLVDI